MPRDRVYILMFLPILLSVACSNSTRHTVQDLESQKKEHAQQVVDQSKPVILSIIEESSLDMVNSMSFSIGFEGFNIEDQDMELIDQRTIAFYSQLLNDPALMDAQARLYGGTFTSDELQQMAHFYATPAGQKLLAQNSRLTRSIRTAVQARMYEQMPQYMASLKGILKGPGSGAELSGEREDGEVGGGVKGAAKLGVSSSINPGLKTGSISQWPQTTNSN